MTIRREFLASVGMVVGLAGCSSTPEENSTSTQSPTSPPTEEQTTNGTPGNEAATSTSDTPKSQKVGADLDVSIDQAEWVEKGVVAEYIISNRADAAIRPLEIIVDWYDSDGNFVDWDSKMVPLLARARLGIFR